MDPEEPPEDSTEEECLLVEPVAPEEVLAEEVDEELADSIDEQRLLEPLLDQVSALLPHIDTASFVAREVQPLAELVQQAFGGLAAAHSLAEAVNRIHLPIISPAESALANMLAVNLRGLDQLATASARHNEYVATARWAEQALGFGAITNWRLSLQVDSSVERLLQSVRDANQLYLSEYTELGQLSRKYASLTDWVVQQDPTDRLLGEISGKPLADWRDLVSGLSPQIELRDVHAALWSGYTGLGILGADLLTSAPGNTTVAATSVSRIEDEVVLPWEAGRVELANQLYERLGALDPTVPDLLKGAWDDLDRNGPAAVEKVAHCVTEALDRTLRAAAPDAEVRAWHAESDRPAVEWEGRDAPPHTLRVRYLAHHLGRERDVVIAQFESLIPLRTRLRQQLQAAKHASQGDLLTVRTLLLACEQFLMQLFLTGDVEDGSGS